MSALLALSGCEVLAPLDALPPEAADASSGGGGNGGGGNGGGGGTGGSAKGGSSGDTAGGGNGVGGGGAGTEISPLGEGLGPCSSQLPFPSTPILDHFDGQLDHWVKSVGSPGVFSIENGVLVGSKTDNGELFWSERFGPNQEVYARFVDWAPEVYTISVLLKKQSPAQQCENVIVHFGYSNSEGIEVEACDSDSATGYDTVFVHLLRNQQVGARMFEDGRVDVYVDGQCKFGTHVPYRQVPAPSWLHEGGYIGLAAVPSSKLPAMPATVAPQWADFGGGTFTP